MKTCSMDVCFYTGDELVYAVNYEGLMSRKYLYLNARSFGGETKPYVRVRRWQTVKGEGWHLCRPDALLTLDVDANVGVEDPRLEKLSPKSPLIRKIDKVIDEFFMRPFRKCPA